MKVTEQIVEINQEKDAKVMCEADGNPPPHFLWYRNVHVLAIGGRKNIEPSVIPTEAYPYKSTLTIQKAVWSDTGSYRCEAHNTLGDDASYIHLVVKCK